jgi:hypothetical protein
MWWNRQNLIKKLDYNCSFLPSPLPPPMIPTAFRPYRQFILYELVGKDKKPLSPHTFHTHDPHDPAIWLDADTVMAYASASDRYGVGFVFTDMDPFFFLDLDDVLQPDGTWAQIAVDLCTAFTGCYVEISVSGTGLHIFGTGVYKPHGCQWKPSGSEAYHLDFFHTRRFVALTGTGAQGCASYSPQPTIDWLIDSYFPPGVAQTPVDWTTEPVPEWNGLTDDQELIDKMLSSKSAGAVLGGRASVQALWTADADQLATHYPHANNPFDHSSADAALCQHLAFWTGKDCERIDRLMRLSGLSRDKWLSREDYRQRTILHAVGHCNKVYEGRPPPTPSADGQYRDGFQFLSIQQQVDLFKGCTYIQDLHQIFTPNGSFLKPEQFRAVYGGYVFALDSINDKTTKKAWEAFTESQGYNFPKVQSLCFRPELPAGEIIQEENRTLINTYVPITTERRAGDVTPFLNHLAAMLPEENDQIILLSYLAAIPQYPGVKFQWTPLIQGCEGNGKTLFINCVSHAVGHRYTHLPNASDLGGNGAKFTHWLQNKLFIGIEEIYVSDRREVSEALKPLITNPRVEIQGKGANQVTGDNRANFLLCSNHKDAILKNRTDRRYCVFFTAQQDVDDMRREGWLTAAGMPTPYFKDLYNWLRGGGYAAVNEFLRTYQIPEQYNPATNCHRAPVTSSTYEAIDLSLGGVEQEILEAVESGTPGFAGGWISSLALDRLLKTRRDEKRITQIKRKELLLKLGYVLHPWLRNGRVNNIIPMDAGKPRLYIKKGHLVGNLQYPRDIVERYVKDQGGEAVGPPGTGVSHDYTV